MIWFAGLSLLAVGYIWWVMDSQISRQMSGDAQATCMAVYNSIDQYETEYDRLPAPTSAAKDKDWDTNSSSEENLISILKARDEDANLKAIDFLGDVRDAKQVRKVAKWPRPGGGNHRPP